jgi:hypothetical protein
MEEVLIDLAAAEPPTVNIHTRHVFLQPKSEKLLWAL